MPSKNGPCPVVKSRHLVFRWNLSKVKGSTAVVGTCSFCGKLIQKSKNEKE